MISQADVARYHETGYLVVPDVLDADILGRCRAALDKLVADAASVLVEPSPKSHAYVSGVQPELRLVNCASCGMHPAGSTVKSTTGRG